MSYPLYLRSIRPLVYKINNNLYMPDGVNQQLTCNHNYIGVMGINMAGEEVPLPQTTIPPFASPPGTSYESAMALVEAGRVWIDQSYFADASMKVVVKVKDNQTGNVLYVDATSYNANIANCNYP